MSGRYAFSLPEPQPRDGWFRIGTVDVTTTLLVALLGGVSMVLFAIDRDLVAHGVFVPELVRDGEVWRLFLWPLVNIAGIWELLGLVVFWYFGRAVEDQIGKVPQAVLLVAMTVIPAIIVTLVNVANDPPLADLSRWTVSTWSVSLLGLGLLCIFCFTHPQAPFFFNIPGWVVALALVAMRVLQIVAYRQWADLIMLFLVIGVGLFGARQRGMVEHLTAIPVFGPLAGAPPSPYGHPASGGRARSRKGRKGRASSGGAGRGSTGSVVAGPWADPSGGPTPLEQAELDSLLDIISERGVDALTSQERKRLDELRRRLRGS